MSKKKAAAKKSGGAIKPAKWSGDPEKPCKCDPNDPAAVPCGHPGCHVNPYVPDHAYQALSEGDPCRLCGFSLKRHQALAPKLNPAEA